MKNLFIAIDLETTGLDPALHVICQLGFTIFTPRSILLTDSYDIYCDEQQIGEASPQALEVNLFTPERMRKGMRLRQVMEKIFEMLMRYRCSVGEECSDCKELPIKAVFQNAPFDVGFLKAAGVPQMQPFFDKLLRRTLDTVTLDFAANDGVLHSLKEIAEQYLTPFEVSRWKRHDAGADSIITARITQEILFQLRGE